MSTSKASSSPAAPHSTENDSGKRNSSQRTVKVECLHNSVEAPELENPLDAAFDLRAYVEPIADEKRPKHSILIPVGGWVLISTGLKVALPPRTEMQIRPRSGLAINHRIDVANSPGTVDPGYRGEVKVILENRGNEPFQVENGDRIAQAAIRPVLRPSFEEVDEVPEDTERGEGGFGHTGV